MFIKDGKRFNIHQKYRDPETGEHGIDMTLQVNRDRFGVTEIPDPVRMPDETHYNQETDDAPYLIVTPKPQEQVDAAHNAEVWQKIRALEASEMMPRSVRDLLKKSCEEDAAKRHPPMTLDEVYDLAVSMGDAAPAAAKGWKKFKDFDDAILELKRTLR